MNKKKRFVITRVVIKKGKFCPDCRKLMKGKSRKNFPFGKNSKPLITKYYKCQCGHKEPRK